MIKTGSLFGWGVTILCAVGIGYFIADRALDSDNIRDGQPDQPVFGTVVRTDQPGLIWVAPANSAGADEVHASACRLALSLGSPDGAWVASQVDCESGGYVELKNGVTGAAIAAPIEFGSENYLLNWSSTGQLLVQGYRSLTAARLILFDPLDNRVSLPATPPNVYDAAFSPDGNYLVYATTDGLGTGSRLFLSQATSEDARVLLESNQDLYATPRWSPDGRHVAVVRFDDVSQPFVIGDLILVDVASGTAQTLAQVDAGRGYAPVWSPNGSQLAFVARENPMDVAADLTAEGLQSNIRAFDFQSNTVQPLTAFDQALVTAPTWSSDGAYLAFSVSRADTTTEIWTLNTETDDLTKATDALDGAYPVWVEPAPDR